MTVAFWVVTTLLALAFLGAGSMKAIRSKKDLAAAGMAWTESFSAGAVKAIGLALTMVGAIVVHVRRKEPATPAIALLIVSVAAAVLGFLHLG